MFISSDSIYFFCCSHIMQQFLRAPNFAGENKQFLLKILIFVTCSEMCLMCAYHKFFCLKVTPINMFSFDIIIISILFLFAKIFSLKFWGGLNLAILPPLICESYEKK